ncbi:protein of unknown function [Pseudomonas sp. JV551A1]|uniref:Uncharacterized protein n=1 Tax=Pseudomonas inefficax TaxID=2078786 RepID=A0AAQ1PAP0_9PSED|nr:protein of unknown function [Pseudomonas sp. JV551A1]SPO63011.1 protein of unknown function [Pseudomonas inefficax]
MSWHNGDALASEFGVNGEVLLSQEGGGRGPLGRAKLSSFDTGRCMSGK